MANKERLLAEFVLHTSYTDIPKATVDAAKVFIADTIGVGIAGYNAHLAKNLRQASQHWSGKTDYEAVILGSHEKVSVSQAAFVNAFQIHAQEFDCVHEAAVVHPMATVFSVIFSELSARRNGSGEELITATTLAVEIATRLGQCVKSPLKFFRPATAGLFGATLGLARLRKLSVDSAVNAMGIALAHCSGTMQAHVEGKPTLALQIANAARAAVMACDLAEHGFTGPEQALLGDYGYLNLFEDDINSTLLLEGLGEQFNFGQVSHKPYPTGRAAHGGLACLRQAMRKGLNTSNLKQLRLIAPPIVQRLVGRPYQENLSVNYARLCFPYLASRMLLDGHIGLSSFSEAKRFDSELVDITRKIQVEPDGSTDPASFAPQQLHAELSNGAAFVTEISVQPASPKSPFTATEQREKFAACIVFGAPGSDSSAMDSLWSLLMNLERENVADIIDKIQKIIN